jgi:ketosteroid isomerase-like protein
MTATNLELAERAYEAMLSDDFEEFVALCAPQAEVEYPGEGVLPYGGRFLGHEGMRRWGDLHDEHEEILDFQIQQQLPSGDFVLTIGRFEGRARDTGRDWETRFAHAMTFQAGLLTRFEAFFDTAAAAEAHREA